MPKLSNRQHVRRVLAMKPLAPTQGERADFAAFCRNASLSQLAEIERKESAAGRRAYAEIARAEYQARQ